jgi:hypothetical protein
MEAFSMQLRMIGDQFRELFHLLGWYVILAFPKRLLTSRNRVLLEKSPVTHLTQAFPNIWWKQNVHHHIHKSLSLGPILSKKNPVHTTPSYFSKIHFNIVLPPTSRRSWDSSVGIVMSYWLGSHSWQGKQFVLSIQTSSEAHPAS